MYRNLFASSHSLHNPPIFARPEYKREAEASEEAACIHRWKTLWPVSVQGALCKQVVYKGGRPYILIPVLVFSEVG